MSTALVWFKRDLRIQDHAPLVAAVHTGNPVIGLYIIEPERFEQPDFDPIHLEWELDNVRNLARELQQRGGHLIVRKGEARRVIEEVCASHRVTCIFSHEETGLMWTWDRDKRVARWATSAGIPWTEYPSGGVIRGLKDRDNWKRLRDTHIDSPVILAPKGINAPDPVEETVIPTLLDLGLTARTLEDRPRPGREAAEETLRSFLDQRGRPYRWAMSGPQEAATHCSRLSPYLALGILSVREVDQATASRIDKIRANRSDTPSSGEWLKSLSSFRSRLAWHCHFIQKLENETTLDTKAQNPVLDEYLDRKLDEQRFKAWTTGNTGLPFLDACMRQLTATGWINFRMRAMLQSVASYALWLPWRDTGNHLARLFLDYEPGIHWSQVGMQSGTTGINTVRAYSVRKQSEDHDPHGSYIRTWVPELKQVPDADIHEPWKMPLMEQQMAGCLIGEDYPAPIVNESEARKEAVSRVYAARRIPEVKAVSDQVAQKHGSRARRSA